MKIFRQLRTYMKYSEGNLIVSNASRVTLFFKMSVPGVIISLPLVHVFTALQNDCLHAVKAALTCFVYKVFFFR